MVKRSMQRRRNQSAQRARSSKRSRMGGKRTRSASRTRSVRRRRVGGWEADEQPDYNGDYLPPMYGGK